MNDLPKTAILGATGFLGRQLLAAYRRTDPHTLGTTRHTALAGQEGLAYLDLTAPDVASLCLREQNYRAAIVAAALPKIDFCEREPVLTRCVNVLGTLELIRQLHNLEILPIYLSSDYVFDGTRQDGYADDAVPCPIAEYGRQKAEVEKALADSGRPFLIVRLSKVFSLTEGDGTLLDEMAAKLRRGEKLFAATDQVFCPTLVDDVVGAIQAVQRHGLLGVVNVCAPQPWSRFDLAIAVADALGAARNLVQPIALDNLPGAVRRPKCTRLLPQRMVREVCYSFVPMQWCLQRLVERYSRE